VLPEGVHETLGPYLDEFNRQLDPTESTEPAPLDDVEKLLDESLSV
jgi:hypothetical protein